MFYSGSKSFHASRFSGGGMPFLKFHNWLSSLKQEFPNIETVYFEEVRRHLGTDAAHIYGGFLAHLSAWCEEHGVPYQGVPVKTIKRFIAGNGNASKEKVIAEVKKKGFNPADDNDADSLAFLLWAQGGYTSYEDIKINTYV
ncbi:MAG: hypothetical protein PG981_001407 [Wolbachia endosymbiont of Ctenocephalides orientis wCori]|nr:MAG: hypothetical protein PG981_001407 [Wolbachia endosymbiont of Ctenocephalides orientis wCori]